MKRPAIIGAFVLVGVGVLLGTTVFRTDIAQATGLASSVTVSNTPAQAVPVREQNLDGGNIRVHEEGMATVSIANYPLIVQDMAVGDGGGIFTLSDKSTASPSGQISALSIHMSSLVKGIEFYDGPSLAAVFLGPASGHSADIDIALTQPIKFSEVRCVGDVPHECVVGYEGSF